MNHARYRGATCTPEMRFWGRVDKNGPNGCWIWTGYRQRFGHGWLGKQGLAHRYSWELLNGPLPAGKCLLHRCDNPPCVNPEHLFLGDRAINNADKVAKGRHAWGEKNKHAILNAEQVLEILRRKPERSGIHGYTKSVAAEYGVSEGAVSAIWAGRSWRNLTDQHLGDKERSE